MSKKYDLDECEIKFTKKIINIPTFYNKKFKVVKGDKRLDFNKKGGSSSTQNNPEKTSIEFEKDSHYIYLMKKKVMMKKQ